jgi:hypothetical protein
MVKKQPMRLERNEDGFSIDASLLGELLEFQFQSRCYARASKDRKHS